MGRSLAVVWTRREINALLTEGDAGALGEYNALTWCYHQDGEIGDRDEAITAGLAESVHALEHQTRRDEGRDPTPGELGAFSSNFRRIARCFVTMGWAPCRN